MKLTSKSLLTVCALAATTLFATAQENQNRDRNRGDRGGTPEEFRQRMAERLKSSLKVTDEEWSVIQPLMEKVTIKQREAMGSRFGGFGGRGGGPGGDRGGDQPARPGQAESDALRKAVETDGTSAEELKAKLTAVRQQRQKSAAELTAAREELRKVLSVRQEATLVSMGILE